VNVSDQKLIGSLIKLLNKMEIFPAHLKVNVGYNGEDEHFSLEEEYKCIRIIKPNPKRERSREFTVMSTNKAKNY